MINQILSRKIHFCGGTNYPTEKCFKRIRKDKGKYCSASDLEKQQTEGPPWKKTKCGSVDHLIDTCPKRPKDDTKRQKNVRFNERGNCASQK